MVIYKNLLVSLAEEGRKDTNQHDMILHFCGASATLRRVHDFQTCYNKLYDQATTRKNKKNDMMKKNDDHCCWYQQQYCNNTITITTSQNILYQYRVDVLCLMLGS